MQNYTDTILYKTHQHFIVVIFSFLSIFLPYAVIIFIAGKYVFEWNNLFQLLCIAIWALVIFAWYYFFWVKSYFIISNEKIIVKVRNGLFSKFHMSIHYKNIRDTAFSKSHILHYLLWYGTLFARSSAWAVGDLEARSIPRIEKVYKTINALHNFSDEERRKIRNLNEIMQHHQIPSSQPSPLEEKEQAAASLSSKGERIQEWGECVKETLDEAIQKEKNVLLDIQGIKEVVVLSDTDRRYIFEHEEERNHGVYEALRKQILFAATHDSTFRDPDEAIVMKAWKKVIFPTVKFHEIKRDSVVSSSPGIDVHEYLIPKFEKLWDFDATLIIWFDI